MRHKDASEVWLTGLTELRGVLERVERKREEAREISMAESTRPTKAENLFCVTLLAAAFDELPGFGSLSVRKHFESKREKVTVLKSWLVRLIHDRERRI